MFVLYDTVRNFESQRDFHRCENGEIVFTVAVRSRPQFGKKLYF